MDLTDAITDDSYSIEHLTYPANAIHADSCIKTLPLICFFSEDHQDN